MEMSGGKRKEMKQECTRCVAVCGTRALSRRMACGITVQAEELHVGPRETCGLHCADVIGTDSDLCEESRESF